MLQNIDVSKMTDSELRILDGRVALERMRRNPTKSVMVYQVCIQEANDEGCTYSFSKPELASTFLILYADAYKQGTSAYKHGFKKGEDPVQYELRLVASTLTVPIDFKFDDDKVQSTKKSKENSDPFDYLNMEVCGG